MRYRKVLLPVVAFLALLAVQPPAWGGEALQGLRVLVGNHQDPRTALEDLGQLRGVQQPLHRTVHHQARLAKRGNDGTLALEGVRGSGRADRHCRTLARSGNDHVERSGAEREERELGELNVDGARLGLREDGDVFARLDLAKAEHTGEGFDPLALDPLLEHGHGRYHRRRRLVKRNVLRRRAIPGEGMSTRQDLRLHVPSPFQVGGRIPDLRTGWRLRTSLGAHDLDTSEAPE